MIEEIEEQPTALERTFREGLAAVEAFRRHMARHPPACVVLVARGTSDNAAQFGRYLLEIMTGIPVSLAAPSIYTLYHVSVDLRDTLVVAISQSGESTDTNLVLSEANQQHAMTVGITNEASSALAKLADHVFLVGAGKEKSVPATKTYTGQLLVLYLLAHALGGAIDLDRLRRVPDWAGAALKMEKEIAERAERYRFMDQALVVGRGLNYSNAFEFALKLMETCYVVAERFSSADLLHGPIAMLEAAFPVFLFAPPGVTWTGLAQLLERLVQIRAEMLMITDKSQRAAVERFGSGRLGSHIVIPLDLAASHGPRDLYTPIPYIIPAQLFAASLAEVKSLDPDRPRALKKITRTV